MAAVLVTGGTGFIGGWCIVELLKRGYDVRTTVRSRSKEGALRSAIETVAGGTDRLTCVIADLTADSGWDEAVAGCDYVLHVASPLGDSSDDEKTLIAAAHDGTLRVLRAAANAGVKRVVMTSAAATARPPHDSDRVSDETMWADEKDPQFDAYRRSKILAERAAWDFVQSTPTNTTLTTILPGAVFGPVLSTATLGSVQIIGGLMQGRPPGLARIGFWVVDVRDLAELHVHAMTAPEAAGERFIAAGDFMWMADLAAALHAGLGERAAKVPTRELPDDLVRVLAFFLKPLRSMLPFLGRRNELTSEKARRMLGFAPRPAAFTVVDCARSLI